MIQILEDNDSNYKQIIQESLKTLKGIVSGDEHEVGKYDLMTELSQSFAQPNISR